MPGASITPPYQFAPTGIGSYCNTAGANGKRYGMSPLRRGGHRRDGADAITHVLRAPRYRTRRVSGALSNHVSAFLCILRIRPQSKSPSSRDPVGPLDVAAKRALLAEAKFRYRPAFSGASLEKLGKKVDLSMVCPVVGLAARRRVHLDGPAHMCLDGRHRFRGRRSRRGPACHAVESPA